MSLDTTAKAALQYQALSPLARATLDRITAVDWPQIEALRKELRWHLVVGVGAAFDAKEQRAGTRRILKAPLDHFSTDFERSGRSVLLGEDQTDADLFELLGQAWLAKNKWRTDLVCDRRGGGGSSIADAFQGVANDGKIVLALADSDARCPGGRTGETWNRLSTAARGKPPFQRAAALPVRAAENLLPFCVYDHALAPHTVDGRGSTPLSRLESLARKPAPPAWKAHADLKHGVTLADVEAMAGSPEGDLWQEIARHAGFSECARQPPCSNRDDCECFVTDGLGKHALERAVRWMVDEPPKRIANLLDFANAPHLDEVALQIVAWGIAPGRRLPAI